MTGDATGGAEGLGGRRRGSGGVAYLAPLTSDTAVVITGCLVPTHNALLVFVQVARDIPW